MKLASFLRAFLKDALSALDDFAPEPVPVPEPTASPLPPTKVEAEMPPVKPPAEEPLGCIALGLIKSMRQSPREWKRIEREYEQGAIYCGPSLLFHFQHTTTKAEVRCYSNHGFNDSSRWFHFGPYQLKDHELKAVGVAAYDHLLVPLQERAKRTWERKERARQRSIAKTLSHFEQLGCSTLDKRRAKVQSSAP